MRVSGAQSPHCRLQGTVVSVIIVFVFYFFVLVFVNENHTGITVSVLIVVPKCTLAASQAAPGEAR